MNSSFMTIDQFHATLHTPCYCNSIVKSHKNSSTAFQCSSYCNSKEILALARRCMGLAERLVFLLDQHIDFAQFPWQLLPRKTMSKYLVLGLMNCFSWINSLTSSTRLRTANVLIFVGIPKVFQQPYQAGYVNTVNKIITGATQMSLQACYITWVNS
jgi:hypothetical protein